MHAGIAKGAKAEHEAVQARYESGPASAPAKDEIASSATALTAIVNALFSMTSLDGRHSYADETAVAEIFILCFLLFIQLVCWG